MINKQQKKPDIPQYIGLLILAGARGLEPRTHGFGDRSSTN